MDSSKTATEGAGTGVSLDEDRISTLPDHLLHHILSFTRTRDAVRTSVLSPRWQHVWIGISTFAFSLSDDTAGLADSVDKLLARSRSHHVEALEISIRHPLHMARANVWLQQAVERIHGNVSISFSPPAPVGDPVVLELDLPCGGRTTALSLLFSKDCIGTLGLPPASAAVFSSLTELKLKFLRLDGGRFSDCVSSCCPRLRKLHLRTVGDVDHLNLSNDALEDLDLDSAKGGRLGQLQVSSRNLRRLRINTVFSEAVRCNEVHDGSKAASFRTPRLEDLVWSAGTSMHPSRVEFADSLATVRRLQVMLLTHAWVDDADFYHNKLTLWLLQHCTAVLCLKVSLWNSAPDPMEVLGVLDEASLAQYEDLVVAVPQLSSVTNLTVSTLLDNHEYGASIATLLSRCNYIETLTVDVKRPRVMSEHEYTNYYDCLDAAMCWCKCPANWRNQKLRLDFLRNIHLLGFSRRPWWMDDLARLLRFSRPTVQMSIPQLRWWWKHDSYPFY